MSNQYIRTTNMQSCDSIVIKSVKTCSGEQIEINNVLTKATYLCARHVRCDVNILRIIIAISLVVSPNLWNAI